jgi:hypothetical protein
VQVGIAIVLNLHVALIGLVSHTAFDKRVRAALVSFPIPYVLGLMLFPTTFYNMRYFVPVLPFVALLCVAGLRSFLPTTQRLVRFAFVGIAALLVIVFNVETVHARVDKWIPRLEVNWIGVPLSLLDNLRMPLHREEKAWLANLNARVETNGVVYLPDVNYYGDARQGVYERAGKIRSDIQTRYVSSRDFAPPEVRFWVQGWRRDRAILEKLGTVQDFGDGLVRIDAQR